MSGLPEHITQTYTHIVTHKNEYTHAHIQAHSLDRTWTIQVRHRIVNFPLKYFNKPKDKYLRIYLLSWNNKKNLWKMCGNTLEFFKDNFCYFNKISILSPVKKKSVIFRADFHEPKITSHVFFFLCITLLISLPANIYLIKILRQENKTEIKKILLS